MNSTHRSDHIWRRGHDGFDVSDAGLIAELKSALWPFNGTVCSLCCGDKPDGSLLCDRCSERCPDPDCRSRCNKPSCPGGGLYKSPDEIMCQHCRDCFLPGLQDDGGRDGFFVYLLDCGYVGMTYNPSRRQREHRVRLRAEFNAVKERDRRIQAQLARENDIDLQEDFRRPFTDDEFQRYRAAAVRNELGRYFDEKDVEGFTRWDRERAEFWRRIRTRFDRYDESAIQWLSPLLDSREDAWLSEWALKFYRRAVADRASRILSYSSAPLVVIEQLGLVVNGSSGAVQCGLRWSLSDDLGPEQIIPIQHFELEARNYDGTAWLSVDSDIPQAERRYWYRLQSAAGLSWRLRAVSIVGTPGPWSILEISDRAVRSELRRLGRVSDVEVSIQNWSAGTVSVSWSGTSLLGQVYSIFRSCDGGEYSLVGEVESSPFDDIVDPEIGSVYRYIVSSAIFGFPCDSSSGSRSATLIVPEREPCEVSVSVTMPTEFDAEVRVATPSVSGWATVDTYRVELLSSGVWESWGNYAYANGDLTFTVPNISDHGFKLRISAGNAYGYGPWVEASMSSADIDRERSRFVKAEIQGWATSLDSIEVGWVVNGIVERLESFGALVRISSSCVGLVHISEVARRRIEDISEVLQVGQVVKVVVQRVNTEQHRLSLSIRAALPDPWDDINSVLSVGDQRVGQVAGVKEYGMFVDIADGVTGLVHISNLGDSNIEWFSIGDSVRVEILGCDQGRRRLPLRLLGAV